MKKRIYNQTSLFGPLYAYLIVLSPPIDIRNRIKSIKEEMQAIADIGERSVKSIAHITLTDKLTDDTDLAKTITDLTGHQNAFEIKTGGWDYFDHGHSVTIYLKIENPDPVVEIAEKLKSAAKTPHISLAKRIPHEKLEKLRPYLDNLNFNELWICTEITVLRKLMSEKHLGFRWHFMIPFEG